MFGYLSQSETVGKLAKKITEPKQGHYSDDPICTMIFQQDFALASNQHLGYTDAAVYNRYEQKLKVSVFFDKRTCERSLCVVFMHGYGSNRLEAINLLSNLPQNYSLCCFDFSGEGKSDGDVITFGYKEKDDIRAILNYLRLSGYKKFVLWGRSMGATCTLLHTLKQKPSDILLQVIDSPFVSFQEAALQLTRKRINIPDVLIRLALEAVRQNLAHKKYHFNPFEVNLNKKIQTNITTLFIYSEHDDVVNPQNSRQLMRNFEGHFQKIIINENHNSLRKSHTIKHIFELIEKYLYRISKCQSPKCLKAKKKPMMEVVSNKKIDFNFDEYGLREFGSVKREKTKERRQNMNHMVQSVIQKIQPKSSIKVYSKEISAGNSSPISPKQSFFLSHQSELVEANPTQRLKMSHHFYL